MGHADVGRLTQLRVGAAGAAVPENDPGIAARHLSFLAGEYEVEMRVRSDGIRRKASLAGYVRDGAGRAVTPSRVQVWLTSPGAEISALPVSPRGLFCARQLPQGRQVLEVVVDWEECHRLCLFV
jgi:hypothetical protein